ncbi:TPA: LOW QUALITY PROTEIN: hypothetical protein N0F65_003428 [Lagenidium giganteum]|uniref:Uncharacterized protein n=1 Tax=Lagenidium giganteum TaxID=4803 RepID=A0AAV2YMD8_9STRA|nr:TPA: LOW QUALITY PROTEIN: hypothetical protein N0F65_003428 [Lagenidium giganteum]
MRVHQGIPFRTTSQETTMEQQPTSGPPLSLMPSLLDDLDDEFMRDAIADGCLDPLHLDLPLQDPWELPATASTTATRSDGRKKPAVNSTRKRQKDELEYLRQKVHELEQELAVLRRRARLDDEPTARGTARSPCSPTTAASSPQVIDIVDYSSHLLLQPTASSIVRQPEDAGIDESADGVSLWERVALRQKVAKQQAEMQNAKLREMLEAQLKVARSLEKILRKRPGCLSSMEPFGGLSSPQFVDDEDAHIFKTLLDHADQVYAELDSVFTQNGLDRSTCEINETRVLVDQVSNRLYMELVNCKLLPFDREATIQAIWRCLSCGNLQLLNGYYQNVDSTDDTISGKSVAMLRLGRAEALVHVRFALRKYVEPDRVVLAWEMASESEGSLDLLRGMQLKEKGWVVMKSLPPKTEQGRSTESTLIQICVRMIPGVAHVPLQQRQQIGALTDLMLGTCHQNISSLHQTIENILLEDMLARSRRGSNTTGKSTRQKQKEEMAYLRECVKELEAELRALRGASSGGSSRTTSPSDSPSVDEDDSADDTACNQLAKYVSTHETTSPKDLWQTVATHQMEEKQKSEAENARLREMLEEQIRIAKSLEKIFRKRPSTARVRRSEYSANGMYAELTQNLDWRVDHLERVFDLNGLSKLKCNFKYAQARSDDERCVYVEYVDSKIFPFSLSDTQEAIWKCLSLKRLTLPTGLYACAESVDDLTMGQFICKLRRRKTYADVDAKFVCKRFVNEHRVILVWESLTDPEESVYYNSGGVQLREKGWTLVESVDDNGDSKTIVQTAVRFIPEIEISNAQDKYKVGVLSDLMVSAYRENMDGLHRAIENELMASLIGGDLLASSLLDIPMAQVEATLSSDSFGLVPMTATAGDAVMERAPSPVNMEVSAKEKETKDSRRGSKLPGKTTLQRQKEEIAYLRECVKELEAELRSLRGANSDEDTAGSSPSDSPSTEEDDSADDRASAQLAKYVATHVKTTPKDLWETIASHQMEEKQKAEAENARLREMLEEQIRVAKSLEKIFRKRPSAATIQAYDTGIKRARQSQDDPANIYDELVQNLDVRLLHLDRVFQLRGLSKMNDDFMYAQARTDDERCVYVEYLNSKSFPFSVSDTQQAIWKCLSMKRLALSNGHYACVEAVDDLIMGQFLCRLRRRKTYTDVDSKFVCKRFVEEHRTVLVWESIADSEGSIYYNTDGVRLREKGWTLVKSIDDQGGDSKTIVQSVVRFIPEIEMSSAQDKSKVGVLSDLMVSSHRENMAVMHRAVVNELMTRLIESEASMTAAATDSSALAPEAGTGDLVVRIRLPAATATRPRAKTDTTSCPSSSIATARSTHRRQKEEMTYLRERVKELEAELRVLRAANNGEDRTAMSPLDSPSVEDDGSPDENASAQLAKYVATHVKTTPTDLWEMVATHQMEEKQKAEAENTRLRAMLEEQIRIAKSLEKIFRKRPSTASLFMCQTIEAYDTGLKRARQYKDDPSAIYDELVQNLDARLHHLERVFDLNGLSKMKFDFMYAQARSDDERCVYVEYLDSKTVPFSRNDTQHAIWKCLSMERLALPNGHYAVSLILLAGGASRASFYQFLLDYSAPTPLRRRKTYADIDAKFVCKQFVEEHRTVMVWESLTDSEGSIYYNTDGVQLREKGWTLIESIDDAKTVVQSAVRFIPEVDVNNARDKYKVGVLSDLMVSSYRANMATLYLVAATARDSPAMMASMTFTEELAMPHRLPMGMESQPSKTDAKLAQSSRKTTVRSTHQRQKEEMAYLRERVKELEAELWSLQGANSGIRSKTTSPSDSPSVEVDDSSDDIASATLAKYMAMHVKMTSKDLWKTIASHQLEEKQKAEAENARLRAMLEEQIRVAKSLEKIFRNQPSAAVEKHSCVVLAYDTGIKRAQQNNNDPSAIYQELAQNLDTRLHHLERVFQLNGLSKMKFDFMYAQARSDDERCVYVEYLDSKTFPFAVSDTQQAIWQCLSMNRLALSNGQYALRRLTNFTDVDAKFVCKRFVEAHRTVMVWESLKDSEGSISYNTDGVQLREKGWTLVESIDNEGGDSKTIVQTTVRFIPEVDVNNARDKYKVGVLSDLMVSSYRANMATLHRAVENELMKRLIESAQRI